jgi:hypothetical protein
MRLLQRAMTREQVRLWRAWMPRHQIANRSSCRSVADPGTLWPVAANSLIFIHIL